MIFITKRDINVEFPKKIISTSDEFIPKDFKGENGFVIDANDEKFAIEILRKINLCEEENLYLKPVFVFSELSVKNKYIIEIIDGITDFSNKTVLYSKVEELKKEIERFKEFYEPVSDLRIIIKTLRKMVSRGKSLNPVLIPDSKFAYTYPLIDIQFPEQDSIRMFSILELIEKEKMAEKVFVERLHYCNKCFSAHLNFKETCPKCNSSNLHIEDVIHHFSCGYVGEEREFIREGNYICPKCGRKLRHIGVDYDKPSVMYTCNSCGYKFQDPLVLSQCFYCEEEVPVENLISKDIYRFEITNDTINFAINGFNISITKFIKGELDIVDLNTFKAILQHESKREKREKTKNTVVWWHFPDFTEKYSKFGEKRDVISREIAKIIKETLRESDLVSIINEATFVVLLLNTSKENAKIAVERVKKRIDDLISSNFEGITLSIHTEYFSLGEFLETE